MGELKERKRARRPRARRGGGVVVWIACQVERVSFGDVEKNSEDDDGPYKPLLGGPGEPWKVPSSRWGRAIVS